MGSGTGDPSILLDALFRSVSLRVLFRSSGVLCFVLPNPIAPARRVPPVCEQMAAQAWLNSEIDATAAAGAEARAAQPGFARDRGVIAAAGAEARAAQTTLAVASAAQPALRGTSRDDIIAHVCLLPRVTAHTFMSKWRKKTDLNGETEMDLTDRQDFDWVGYLKGHPDLSIIVPNGKFVVRFAIARLAIIDKNTRTGRVDFLLFLTMAFA